eukprot:364314-Chlamydomonas_euryale.AAC.3
MRDSACGRIRRPRRDRSGRQPRLTALLGCGVTARRRARRLPVGTGTLPWPRPCMALPSCVSAAASATAAVSASAAAVGSAVRLSRLHSAALRSSIDGFGAAPSLPTAAAPLPSGAALGTGGTCDAAPTAAASRWRLRGSAGRASAPGCGAAAADSCAEGAAAAAAAAGAAAAAAVVATGGLALDDAVRADLRGSTGLSDADDADAGNGAAAAADTPAPAPSPSELACGVGLGCRSAGGACVSGSSTTATAAAVAANVGCFGTE